MGASRRVFLAQASALAASACVGPGVTVDPSASAALPHDDEDLPVVPGGELDPDFWNALRGEFLIPKEEAFFNTGTLGSSPRSVLDAVVAHMTHVDRDIARWDYRPDGESYFTGYYAERWIRDKIARAVRADGDEIALTQNATHGMNFVAQGLNLREDDEVLVMKGSHPGGRGGWELRDLRFGVRVRPVEVPAPPESPEQLIERYEAATTPSTRVWAIPHLTSGTAIRFPVKEMCRRARERGIVSVVDGAQTFCHLRIDVRDMGCDAYFSSPHKWGLAPKGSGFLYVRRDVAATMWPTLASSRFEDHEDEGLRLMQSGTGNLSLLVGFGKALDFFERLGHERVERRVLGLAERLRASLGEVPGVRILSPTHPALTSATTVWEIEGVEPQALQDQLWDRARVRVRRMGIGGVRQCCHVYNLEAEVDRTVAVARELAAS